jgi:hypothetical protein
MLVFVFRNPRRGQVVFHLLKGSQRRLPISRHRGIVTGNRNIGARTAPASVKQGFRQRRPHRPEAGRPLRPVENEVPSNPPIALSITVGFFTRGIHSAAHTPPKVHFIRGIEGQRELAGRTGAQGKVRLILRIADRGDTGVGPH